MVPFVPYFIFSLQGYKRFFMKVKIQSKQMNSMILSH